MTKNEIQDYPAFADSRVEFAKVITYKTKLLNSAYERSKNYQKQPEFERFCAENSGWLEDYATFTALREHFWPRLWRDWPVELRERWEKALSAAKVKLRETISREKFLQYLFFTQWFALKQHCNQSGIEIIGDIPIYVAYDSADVWSHPEIFQLNRYRNPVFVSGVPPDLFSKTGQLWGNPVYNWLVLKKTHYAWWLERLKHNLSMFDRVRLDHFRGFFRYWRVPAGDKTAKNGKWMKGPGKQLFDVLFKRFSKSAGRRPLREKVIAEDLGHITPDVKSYVESAKIAGMRVLQFGFGDNPAKNPHFPKNHVKNSICYTGTHDNNTILAWFTKEIDDRQKSLLYNCLGHKPKLNEINWQMIRLAMSSASDLVIIPVQDILGLGQQARMNHPACALGNWLWRLAPGKLTPQIAKKLAMLTESFGR